MPPPAPAPRPAPPARAPAPRTVAPRAPATGAGLARSSGAAPAGEVAPGVLELKGMAEFKPPTPIAEFLDARKTSTVNARFGNLAQGPLNITTVSKGKYRIKKQPLPLAHPLFARAAEALPALTPSLAIRLEGDKLEGEIGLAAGEQVESLRTRLSGAPELLGLVGFSIPSLPAITNKLEGGSLVLGIANVPIRLGSAFSGSFSLDTKDEAITFSGSATVNVKGLVNGTLDLKRAPDGAITGKASIGLNLPKNISGSVEVAWDGRAITGEGKVGYQGEKLSGEVTLRLMERSQAEQLEAAGKAPEGAPAPAPAAAPGQAKSGKVDYVVFGEGDLNFAFTDWLNGTAHVIVSPKGHVTIIGKITPQKEFILFKQRDYERQLFKVEARASYGLPVVGNIFIFANVSMSAFATVGPAKFYNIVIEGTYSTDPEKSKSFSIRGSLNISAAAGLKLRGEAGVGLEILAHDIKAGAGINGIAGIKGYAEATPIIGYREKAAPGQDKKGEFYIRGELEIAAQPFLGLSGDVFVEVDAPWWSPVPDKKWTWPLFGKEWPIGGSLGIGASVDYVFGSNEWPKLDFKPVEFDSSKFMSDLYADKAKSGSGKEVEKPGKWGEKNSKAADPPPKKPPVGNAKPGKGASPPPAKSKVQPGGGKKGAKAADPNAKTKEGKSVKQLQDEAAKKGKKPTAPGGPQTGKTEAAKASGGDTPADRAKAIVSSLPPIPFSGAGESHELLAEAKGSEVVLFVASKKLNVEEFLKALESRANLIGDEAGSKAKSGVQKARSKLNKVKEDLGRAAKLRATQLSEHISRLRSEDGDAAKALGAALADAASGIKTGASEKEAIPIKWYKPWSKYPSDITLPDNKGKTKFSKNGGGKLDNGEEIGVDSKNRPSTDKTLLRKQRGERSEEARFFGLLERRGYLWKTEKTAADHVTDLGFYGRDHFSNLWPLATSANSDANDVYKQRVPYKDDKDKEIKVGTVFSLTDKWFQIKKGA